MLKMILIAGAGGGAGSIARFLTQQWMSRTFPSSFPWGTLLVNVAGCLIIGAVYALSEKGDILSPEMRLLLATGFCGGFTTFSSFAYENIALMRDGAYLYASAYIAASIVTGLLAVLAGIFLIKTY